MIVGGEDILSFGQTSINFRSVYDTTISIVTNGSPIKGTVTIRFDRSLTNVKLINTSSNRVVNAQYIPSPELMSGFELVFIDVSSNSGYIDITINPSE